jgi:hypothetical protein
MHDCCSCACLGAILSTRKRHHSNLREIIDIATAPIALEQQSGVTIGSEHRVYVVIA